MMLVAILLTKELVYEMVWMMFYELAWIMVYEMAYEYRELGLEF